MLTRRRLLEAATSTAALAGTGLFAPRIAASQTPGVLKLSPMLSAGTRAEAVLDALPGKQRLIKLSYRPPNYETPIEHFRAAIGPSIGPCCYEVDKPVIARLDAAFPGRWGSWVRSRGNNGKWMLDLWAANEEQLREAGMRGNRIANPRLCTGCRGDLFYSYRRGDIGRLVTIAALPLSATP